MLGAAAHRKPLVNCAGYAPWERPHPPCGSSRLGSESYCRSYWADAHESPPMKRLLTWLIVETTMGNTIALAVGWFVHAVSVKPGAEIVAKP